MGVDLEIDRERINDCIRLGERMSPHFAMDLLEHIEGLEAHVALLKASLKQATKAEERVRALEEAVCFFSSVIKSGEPWTETCEQAKCRALSTERMPSDG
jgi:hypothetical protein